MTIRNKELYQSALKAIMDLFSDQSVSQSEAIQNLQELRDEISMLLDSLEEDE